jgi:hypothetical protein
VQQKNTEEIKLLMRDAIGLQKLLMMAFIWSFNMNHTMRLSTSNEFVPLKLLAVAIHD